MRLENIPFYKTNMTNENLKDLIKKYKNYVILHINYTSHVNFYTYRIMKKKSWKKLQFVLKTFTHSQFGIDGEIFGGRGDIAITRNDLIDNTDVYDIDNEEMVILANSIRVIGDFESSWNNNCYIGNADVYRIFYDDFIEFKKEEMESDSDSDFDSDLDSEKLEKIPGKKFLDFEIN